MTGKELMKTIYPAIFIPEDKGEYSVIYPDLDGCATCGDNLEHALEMAQEALMQKLGY
ncbi:MAG: type II toxin-antitoxin system HicB family antitoxin [Oscillospiraceae bacterium]|nr:type II toxin-antitoxin system HicB family antitoxin [Oscillospiraceae bacterium]